MDIVKMKGILCLGLWIIIGLGPLSVGMASTSYACSYDISSSQQEVPARGGTFSLIVTTEDGCAWSSSYGGGSDWLQIESGDLGTGSGELIYTVTSNEGDSKRTGSIIIQPDEQEHITFTINQASFESIVWDTNQVLGQNGAYDFAGIYEFDNLTIADNVEINSSGVSQLILYVRDTLTLGKNVAIKTRNGFYPEAPKNTISQLTADNLTAFGIDVNGFRVYPNMFGKGGDGGNSNESNGSYVMTTPVKYNGVGGPGGGGFGGGKGGVTTISAYNVVNAADNGGKGSKGGQGWNGSNSYSSHENGGSGGVGGGSTGIGADGGNGGNQKYASGGGGGGGNGGNGGVGGNGEEPRRNGGKGGGGGGYGGGVLTIIADTILYDETSPPKFLVSGQKGGLGGIRGQNGEGGLIIIETINYIL